LYLTLLLRRIETSYKYYHRLQKLGILFNYQNSLLLLSKMVGYSFLIQSHYLLLLKIPKVQI